MVSVNFFTNYGDAGDLRDDFFYDKEFHPVNFNYALIPMFDHAFGNRGVLAMEAFNVILNFPFLQNIPYLSSSFPLLGFIL